MSLKRYRVLSPDGFDIERDKIYKDKTEALDALEKFCERYTIQGYYSMSDRTRISLSEIKNYCEIKPLENDN